MDILPAYTDLSSGGRRDTGAMNPASLETRKQSFDATWTYRRLADGWHGTQSDELNSSRACRSDTQLAPDNRRHFSAEDFYGVQHFFVWQRRDTHLESDARNATENFFHVKDLFRDRFSVAD
jgi:hypothetical protein